MKIKHDGYRLIVRREGARVRCYTRNGHDWADRFPGIVAAALRIKASSFVIDGEVVVPRADGMPDFNALRSRGHEALLYAFDLIELDGDDLRHHPLTVRNTTLTSLIARAAPGLRFNEHIEADGSDVFNHACKLGLEGIVSKRKESRYRSGRSPDWIKSKNPNAPAVKREAEIDWGR